MRRQWVAAEMTRMGLMRLTALWVGVVALLAGCGGSNVGNQQEPQPQAVAVVLGHAFTATTGGISTTVRAGSEVVMSGKESRKGDDDSGVPILRFEWRQLDSGMHPVQLVEQTATTVSFTAPQVREATTLSFRLDILDAKNQGDSTEVSVKIEPIPDADRFLEFLQSSDQFSVVAATSVPLASDAGADERGQIDFTVTVTKLVSFKDRNGIAHSKVALAHPQVARGGWSQRLGSGGAACDSIANPRVRFATPRIDLDDELADGSGTLSDFIEASDVDAITIEARVEISSAAAVQAGVAPRLCLVDGRSSSASADSLDVEIEALLPGSDLRDTRAKAQAYYDTIDSAPAVQKKDTLRRWLAANGFNPDVSGYGADSYALYANNYDLGFGRDMYTKIGACDGNAAQWPLEERIGRCDVASIVMNYPSLEAGARRLNAILAVAMEYSAARPGGERFTKFYTFAPDRRDGEFKRVLSVNLDGRGEKYMPQACVVCHGGVPGSVDAAGRYANDGNVHAGFLLWDLGSLLFSDTDPSFTGKSRYGGLRQGYTRQAQESQFKALNASAYLTFADPPGLPGRFALARELVEGWYGGRGLPEASAHDGFVPKGWSERGLDDTAGTADDNPAAASDLYTHVFARHCRMCHVAHVPNPAIGDPRSEALCNSRPEDDPTGRVGLPNQVPVGCYRQFETLSTLQDMLSGARMPLARLTLDRLWLQQPDQSTSSGELLAEHLGVPAEQLRPGATTAAFALSQQQSNGRYETLAPVGIDVATGQQQFTARRNQALRVTESGSKLPVSFTYTLDKPAESRSALVNPAAPDTAFVPDRPGVYALTLDVGGSGARRRLTQQILVGNRAPVVSAGPFVVAQGSTVSANAAEGLLLHAFDDDGDPLTASLGANVPGCSTAHAAQVGVSSSGAFTYTHNGDLATSDVFNLIVSDGMDTAQTCVTVLIQDAPDTVAPGAPVIDSAIANSVGTGASATFPIALSWVAAQDLDQFGNSRPLAGYQIYRRPTQSTEEFPLGALTIGTTFIDSSALPNTSYTYRVAAVDRSNNRTFSAPVTRTTYSSYRANINAIFSTSLDLRDTCASSGCHVDGGDGHTQGGLRLDRDPDANYLQIKNKVSAGSFPCWPNQRCPPGSNIHSGGQALSSILFTGAEQRFDAYQRITQWIAEGALDN